MEPNNRENRTGLKFKFALFYLISVGIIVYVLSLFWPGNASSGMLSAARPAAAADDAGAASFVANLQTVNSGYKRLKELDQEFAQQTTPGTVNEQLSYAENTVNKSLDSLAIMARSLTDRKAALQIQNFVDAYRFALSDRSAMRVYKIAAMSPNKTNGTTAAPNTEALTQMQAEIAARDKRIAELQNQNYSLEQRVKTTAGNAGAATASQQNVAALQATVADQEKKLASLASVNSALEKQNAAFSRDAGSKPSADNGSAALRTQNAALERQVASLTAEVRLAQVDCSLTRADASQIISNSKQRKALLSDALVTLNNLSSTSDGAIRKKVTDKMVKLNQVASTVRD